MQTPRKLHLAHMLRIRKYTLGPAGCDYYKSARERSSKNRKWPLLPLARDSICSRFCEQQLAALTSIKYLIESAEMNSELVDDILLEIGKASLPMRVTSNESAICLLGPSGGSAVRSIRAHGLPNRIVPKKPQSRLKV